MIKIGHVADIKNDTQIPESIKSDVISVLMILDECYGSNRNIDSDMGGFVVICTNSEQLDIPYFDSYDIAEYTENCRACEVCSVNLSFYGKKVCFQGRAFKACPNYNIS